MRAALLLCLLAGCRGPDRWSTSISRGQGDASSPKVDFDTEETTLEIGVSGPIGSPPDRRYPVMPAWAPVVPDPTPPPPSDDWGWLAPLLTALVSIVGALAGVKYIPSSKFEGPFDRKKV